MKAQAVVFTDKMKVEFLTVDVPEPGPEDVVIDVEHSWISIGTESSYLRGERISGETPYRKGDPWPFPYIAGYQKTGVIRSIGSNVRELIPGDRVFATISNVSGMFFDFAGHISPAVTHQGQVWRIPDGKPALDFAGLVLAQVGYNCGDRPSYRDGDVAVVIGDGLVGHWAAHTLRHRGAEVYVLGRHESRLNKLPQGIHPVNVGNVAGAEALYGKSIQVVVDSVGAMDTLRGLMPLMGHDSHIVSAGYLGDQGIVNIQTLRDQEITLHCPSGWSTKRMNETLQGIAEGWLHTSSLITHRFPVQEAREAWQTIIGQKSNCLGVILDWEYRKLS